MHRHRAKLARHFALAPPPAPAPLRQHTPETHNTFAVCNSLCKRVRTHLSLPSAPARRARSSVLPRMAIMCLTSVPLPRPRAHNRSKTAKKNIPIRFGPSARCAAHPSRKPNSGAITAKAVLPRLASDAREQRSFAALRTTAFSTKRSGSTSSSSRSVNRRNTSTAPQCMAQRVAALAPQRPRGRHQPEFSALRLLGAASPCKRLPASHNARLGPKATPCAHPRMSANSLSSNPSPSSFVFLTFRAL